MSRQPTRTLGMVALVAAAGLQAAPQELALPQLDRITAGLGAAALATANAMADFLTTTNSGTFTQVLASPYNRFNPLGGMSAAAAGHSLAIGVGGNPDTDTQVTLATELPGGKVYSIGFQAQGVYVEFSAAAQVAIPQPYNPLAP